MQTTNTCNIAHLKYYEPSRLGKIVNDGTIDAVFIGTMQLRSHFASLFAVALSLTVTRANADQEYVWTGGAAGYSGTIILDSNSNPAGSISDIVSGQITTPSGTFDFDPTTIAYSQPAFDWNPSQITDMWIDWFALSYTFEAGFGENISNTGENFVGSYEYPSTNDYLLDVSGSWKASNSSVPDATTTSALLGGALVSLTALRRRFAR
jgi:hypothetical protein